MKPDKTEFDDEQERQAGPLSRWVKRKQAVLQEKKALEGQQAHNEMRSADEEALPTDSDMPPVESLTADSDYSGFMSPRVSESLRRLALRKLFHSAEFNICDGLDDYDGDYTSFAKLGGIITADMKHQMEVAARKQLQAMKENDGHGDAGDQPEQNNALADSRVPPLTEAEQGGDGSFMTESNDEDEDDFDGELPG